MGWFGGVAKDGLFFRDFAGSTAVHTVGGAIALIGAIALGPRIGRKFARDGGGPLPPHDVNIAAIGAVLLWFGWYGFNPGSTLSIIDAGGVARVAINTTFAASAGGVVPMATDLLEHLRIDDPVGAVPVHLACGIWGTMAIRGLFADGSLTGGAVDGLFYGGGGGQLWIQVIGNVSCIVFVVIASVILMFGLRKVPGSWNLRLSREAELEGIDLYCHGIPAYHMEIGQGMVHTTQTSG